VMQMSKCAVAAIKQNNIPKSTFGDWFSLGLQTRQHQCNDRSRTMRGILRARPNFERDDPSSSNSEIQFQHYRSLANITFVAAQSCASRAH